MNHLKLIIPFVIVFCASFTHVQAQTPQNWDQDIRYLRHTATPGFHCKADDYLQYSPAALMLGLKLGGYEGRTGWWQMLTSDAFSIAIMTGVTQGLKYSIRRARPDNSRRNSFPSGHTGTAFLTATMLHKEYGWRSPWWSIGGYTVAAFTGVSRILNDRHWMTDVVAGAAIGIGSVHLGYWLSDLIFKGKHINPAYETPSFSYDPGVRHYVASMYFGRRFILGSGRDYFTDGFVTRGGSAGLSTDIPLLPGIGITARIGANSLTYSTGLTSNSFDALAGGYYNQHLGKRFEIQAKAMAGLAWKSGRSGIYRISSDPSEDILDGTSDTISITTLHRTGANLCAGLSLGFLLDDNFKIKAFADYDAIGSAKGRWLHTALVGWGAAWVW